MSKQNGTALLIYVEVSSVPTAIAGSKNNELSIDGSVIDVTSKDSGAWKEKLAAGQLDWKMSGDGLFDTAGYNFDDALASMANQERLMFRFSSEISGETYYEGYGYFTSLKKGAPLEEGATFSYSIEGDGAITPQTV